MAKKHHVITFSTGTVIGIFGMLGFLTDKAAQLMGASETTRACSDLIQSLLTLF